MHTKMMVMCLFFSLCFCPVTSSDLQDGAPSSLTSSDLQDAPRLCPQVAHLGDDCVYTSTTGALLCRVDPVRVTSVMSKLILLHPCLRNVTMFRLHLQYFTQTNALTNLEALTGLLPNTQADSLLDKIVLQVTNFTSAIQLNYLDFVPLIQQCRHLKYLHLGSVKLFRLFFMGSFNNVFDDLRIVNMSFLSYPEYLDRYFYVSQFTKNIGTERLEVLDISGNGITVVHGSFSELMPNLKFLDVSFNNIMSLDVLGMLDTWDIALHPSLEVLHYEMQHFSSLDTFYRKTWIDPDRILAALGHSTPLTATARFESTLFQSVMRGFLQWYGGRCQDVHRDECYNTSVTILTPLIRRNLTTAHEFNIEKMVAAVLTPQLQKVPSFPVLGLPLSPPHQSDSDPLCYLLKAVDPALDPVPCPQLQGKAVFDLSCTPPWRLTGITQLQHIYIDGTSPDSIFFPGFSLGPKCQQSCDTVKPSLCSVDLPLKTLSMNHIHLALRSDLGFPLTYLQAIANINLPSLTTINLGDNKLGDQQLEPLFNKLDSSTVVNLDLSQNQLTLSNKSEISVCDQFPNLVVLNMSRNQIKAVNFSYFTNCHSIKTIDLQFNQISTIYDFPTMLHHRDTQKSILQLNLAFNQIAKFPKELRENFDKMTEFQSVEIDLRGNNLDCGCSGKDFQHWLKKTSVERINIDDYRCATGLPVNHLDLNHLDKECRPPWITPFTAVIVTAIITTLILLTVYKLYKERYRLQTWYIRIKAKRHPPELAAKNFKYDAFLSYAAEDRFWTHAVLVKKLEEKFGFKVCVHYRDFPVGGFISDAIIENMQQSRCFIIILSERALQKPWFKFECHTALNLMVERGSHKGLIIIQQGKILEQQLDSIIRRIWQTYTIISWPDDNLATADTNSSTSPDGSSLKQYTSSSNSSISSGTGQEFSSLEEYSSSAELQCKNSKKYEKAKLKLEKARYMFWFKLRTALHKSVMSSSESSCGMCCWQRPTSTEIQAFADVPVISLIGVKHLAEGHTNGHTIGLQGQTGKLQGQSEILAKLSRNAVSL